MANEWVHLFPKVFQKNEYKPLFVDPVVRNHPLNSLTPNTVKLVGCFVGKNDFWFSVLFLPFVINQPTTHYWCKLFVFDLTNVITICLFPSYDFEKNVAQCYMLCVIICKWLSLLVEGWVALPSRICRKTQGVFVEYYVHSTWFLIL